MSRGANQWKIEREEKLGCGVNWELCIYNSQSLH